MGNRKKILIGSIALLILLATAEAKNPVQVTAEWNYITCVILRIIQFMAAGIAALVLVLAGLKLMTSGDLGDRAGAKKMMTQVVSGLIIIIIAAQLINYLVAGTDVERFDISSCEDALNISIPVTTTLPGTNPPIADARAGIVPPPPPPEKKIMYAAPNIRIYFDGTRSLDLDGEIESYIWWFDDGEEATGDVVEHTYINWGNYSVWLTVVDNDSLQASNNVEVIMQALEAHILQPADNQGFPNKTVSIDFLGEGRYGVQFPTHPPYKFNWTSGITGVLSTNKSFTVNASDLGVGAHIINLTVEDYGGNTASDSIRIHVVECNDSDAGDDPEHGGTLTDYAGGYRDSCFGEDLTEYYCLNKEKTIRVYNCSLYCKNTYGADYEGTCELDALNQGFCECASYSEKDMSKYPTTFLVSDVDWVDALSLVSVAVWTNKDEEINKYPLLIYHKEDDVVDVDSIILFLQQYKPSNLTIYAKEFEGNCDNGVDDDGDGKVDGDDTDCSLLDLLTAAPTVGAGLDESRIEIVHPDTRLNYWKSYKEVVYVEADYGLTLMASTYASLINAPLIVEGSDLDKDLVFSGKTIICIGEPGRACSKKYTLSEIQQKYYEKTNPDNFIVVNSGDLDIGLNKNYGTKDGTISKIFYSTSLPAPALAASKHALIVPILIPGSPENPGCSSSPQISNNIQTADEIVDKQVGGLLELFPGAGPDLYITIVSSPKAIPDSYYSSCHSGIWQERNSVDKRYGSINVGADTRYLIPGRIYGITVSDASSYIARALWYQELYDQVYGGTYTGLSIGHSFSVLIEGATEIKEKTSGSGYNSACFTSTGSGGACGTDISPGESYYADKTFITFGDHGGPDKWSNTISWDDVPDLGLSYIHGYACLTCDYWQGNKATFCPNMIRKGSIGYVGSVGVTYLGCSDEVKAIRLLTEDEVLGKVCRDTSDTDNFILLGDPSLKLNLKNVAW